MRSGASWKPLAARTIAERGVQLIGTAHGRTLENLLLNPTLSDLVGGIESVTLSDEEARRRGTQKTVLERRAPPTFDVLVEIQERDRAGHPPRCGRGGGCAGARHTRCTPEIRYRDEKGEHPHRKSLPRRPVQPPNRAGSAPHLRPVERLCPHRPRAEPARREEETDGEHYPAERDHPCGRSAFIPMAWPATA